MSKNKSYILNYKTDKKVQFNIESFNEIFGECPFICKNIHHFARKINSIEYTHEIDSGILDYLVFNKFVLKDKKKEQIIKNNYKNNGINFDYEQVKENQLKAEIIIETDVETDEEGNPSDSTIGIVSDPNTLDDVNDLNSGVDDNDPICGPKKEDKQFEECDLEYGLEVFCYNASKLPWSDYRLHFPIFRGLYSIFDNADGTTSPPLACSYSVENDYLESSCGIELEFPKGEEGEESGGEDEEERDTLRDADLHYDFFVEEQEEEGEGDSKPSYIFQLGYGGEVDLYPVIKDVIKVTSEKIDKSADANNRDYNGLFSEDDIAYIRKNKPSEYSSENYAQLFIRNDISNNPSIASEGTPSRYGTRPQPPSVVTHGSYSFIMTEENIIINEKIALDQGNVSLGGEDGNGVIIELGNIYPIQVIAVTKEPLNITAEDIRNGDIPSVGNNLFQGFVPQKQAINLRADHDATIAGDNVGYSKYIAGYDIDNSFNEDLVNRNIVKKIIGPQENFGSRKGVEINNNSDVDPNAYYYNGLNSNKIKIDSSAVLDENQTDNPEPLLNPSIYITAIVSNNNYYRQITQVHSKVKNDRPVHIPKRKAAFKISPDGPGQLPIPDGNYEDFFPRNISESFIFNLFCHNISGENIYEWRLSELANDAWLIWKRWLVNSSSNPSIYPVEQAPGEGSSSSQSTSRYIDQGDPYGYGESEPMFFTADSEGIKVILVSSNGTFSSSILLPREDIWDQDWFEHFLQTNDRSGKKIESDLGFDYSRIDTTRELTQGLLFDVSYFVNNNIPDAAKIPYERCFAAAIMQCSKAVIPQEQGSNGDPSLGGGAVSNNENTIAAPSPDENGGSTTPIVGVGIQPLDFINNPFFNQNSEIPELVQDEDAVLWCKEQGVQSDLITSSDPKDKLLLKESLELLRDQFNQANKQGEAQTAQAYINSIINQQRTQRPNDLSYSKFVSKISNFDTKDAVSGYQRRASVTRFSEEDKNGEDGYNTVFKGKTEYQDIFGPDSTKQSLVVVPASGDPVYAYAREEEEADEQGEEVGTRDLPPGRYRIQYFSGGYLYGCGDGTKASIHDPDTDCDGVYVQFNSPAPCADNQFLAPGTRVPYDNIGDLEDSFRSTEDSEDSEEGVRVITHLGGPIVFQLVLKERSREKCEDGQSTVYCEEGSCLTYCVSPVLSEGSDDPEDVEISPVITDQYNDLSTTTLKNYVELPTLYEPGGLSENARMYVETFSIPRFDEQGNEDHDYLHPQFNCLGMYPDHPIEYMDLIDIGDTNLVGDISVASFGRKHDGILVTPEFNTSSLSYHIVNFEKHPAWSEFGKDVEEFVDLTKRTVNDNLTLEEYIPFQVEEKIKSRSDNIQKWASCYYNRGKIISTVDGAICIGNICSRAVAGPLYNTISENDAYFFTRGNELRESIDGVKDRDIRGWVKSITVRVDPVTVYTADYIGFSPFGRKTRDIVSNSDLVFVAQNDGTSVSSTTRYDDGVHLLSEVKFENNTTQEYYQTLDVSFSRVYDGGKLLSSDNFDPSDITQVKYLKDDIFQKYKIRNTRNSTVVDEKNRVFIFYEHRGNIACAMGHNLNSPKEQWFNFEGIVRTLGGEKASQPCAVTDAKGKTIYLFFKLNNQFICQKTMSAANFVIKDAFKEYWSISNFNEDTSDDFGLTQFEFEGRDIRKGVINVIEGGSFETCSNGVDIQAEEEARADANLEPRIRLAFKCIRNTDISNEEYGAYKDRKGNLVLFFTSGNRQFMNIMKSNNEGKDWQDVQRYMHMTHLPFLEEEEYDFDCDTGLANNVCVSSTYLIEEDASSVCKTRLVERMELVFDEAKNIIYLIYIYNEGLYVRQFDAANIERIPEVLPRTSEGNIGKLIKNHFNLNSNSDNKPVLITGRESEDDLEKSLYTKLQSATDSSVSDKGNGVYQVSKPGGHVTRDGILKIYYFDKDLILWSVSLLPGDLKAIPGAS